MGATSFHLLELDGANIPWSWDAINRRVGDLQVGGSRPAWLILLTIKTRVAANQQQIADAVGIRGSTLTYHLNAMEAEGLLERRRDTENRRVHVVELTDAGHRAFDAMHAAAVRFDQRVRKGLSEKDIAALQRILQQMSENVRTR